MENLTGQKFTEPIFNIEPKIIINDDDIPYLLGEWFGLFQNDEKLTAKCSYLKHGILIDPKLIRKNLKMTYLQYDLVRYRLAKVLKDMGIPANEACILNNFTIDENGAYLLQCHLIKSDQDYIVHLDTANDYIFENQDIEGFNDLVRKDARYITLIDDIYNELTSVYTVDNKRDNVFPYRNNLQVYYTGNVDEISHNLLIVSKDCNYVCFNMQYGTNEVSVRVDANNIENMSLIPTIEELMSAINTVDYDVRFNKVYNLVARYFAQYNPSSISVEVKNQYEQISIKTKNSLLDSYRFQNEHILIIYNSDGSWYAEWDNKWVEFDKSGQYRSGTVMQENEPRRVNKTFGSVTDLVQHQTKLMKVLANDNERK